MNKRTAPLLMSLFVLLFTAACGGGASAPTGTPIPTRVTIPTYQYLTPTTMPATATVVATEAVVGADTEALDRGKTRYEALDCGSCHGANAEGGSAPAIAGTTLSEDEFLTFLRSGGKLGNAHLYATNRISNSSVHNLYLYLESLGT